MQIARSEHFYMFIRSKVACVSMCVCSAAARQMQMGDFIGCHKAARFDQTGSRDAV
jgi:hypothetical protein